MNSTVRVVGIDLGTTNSVVAFVDESGEAHAIAGRDGERIVPSVVWFPQDDESRVEVGDLGKSQAVIDPDHVAMLFKRGMGSATFLDSKKPFVVRGEGVAAGGTLQPGAEEDGADRLGPSRPRGDRRRDHGARVLRRGRAVGHPAGRAR